VTLASAPDCASPRAATQAFCAAINRGELARACTCFTRDGCLVTPDGTVVHGREAIGGVLAQLVGARVQLSVDVSAVIEAGEVALAHERWQIRTGDADSGFTRDSKPTLVLRRVESVWKLAVAAPWGWGG
jgi:ketosteroid isomerase-like protein